MSRREFLSFFLIGGFISLVQAVNNRGDSIDKAPKKAMFWKRL